VLRLLQGQRDIPLATVGYGHSESDPGLDRDLHILFAGTNCLIDLGLCIKFFKSGYWLTRYNLNVFVLTTELRSFIEELETLRISDASSEDGSPLRDLIATCFILVLFKILMELRDCKDLIGLLECRSIAELDALKHAARSRLRPKWLLDSQKEDFGMTAVQRLQKVYEGQIPAIRAEIDDLLKLLAEVVDLGNSVHDIFGDGKDSFRSEAKHDVSIPLERLKHKMSMESLESSAKRIFRAVESLDKSADGSRTYITLFINKMMTERLPKIGRSNGFKLPARSLFGIGYWIPKSNAYEFGSHESESSLILASKVGPVILTQEDVERILT
jgi:hypothetical protein